jgi:hypothetical protein
MRLILVCTGCDLTSLKSATNTLDDIAVVAQVTATVKTLEPTGNDPDYTVRGKLIDFRLIGDYAMKNLERLDSSEPQ